MVTGIILSYLRGFLLPHERRSIVRDRKIKFTPRREVCFGRDEKNLTCRAHDSSYAVGYFCTNAFQGETKKKKKPNKKTLSEEHHERKIVYDCSSRRKVFFFHLPAWRPFLQGPNDVLMAEGHVH